MVPSAPELHEEVAPLALAPLLRLDASSLETVLSFLSLREIANLSLVGSRDLWALIQQSTYEATQLALYWPTGGEHLDFRILPHNPFHLLATLPNLHTVRLHRLWWMPKPEESCPFAALPSSLVRLEFSSVCSDFQYRLDLNAFHEFDYATAFPELRVLRIGFTWEYPIEPGFPKLPPTLTVLTSVHLFEPNLVMKYLGGLEFSDDLVNDHTPAPPFSSTRPSQGFPLPNLAVLDLTFHEPGPPPAFESLPFSLVHFGWNAYCQLHIDVHDPFYNYDADAEELDADSAMQDCSDCEESTCPSGSASRLRSVKFAGAALPYHEWVASCPAPLKYIHCTHNMEDPAPVPSLQAISPHARKLSITTLDITTVQAIRRSGARLSSFFVDEVQTNLDFLSSNDFAALTKLELYHCDDSAIAHLPRGLTSLWWCHYDGGFYERHALALPQGLLDARLYNTPIELCYVPLLPRSIRHLVFLPCNWARRGLSVWAKHGPLPDDGLPYDEITPTSNILYGLPPNLLTLGIEGNSSLDPRFGLFLPRSLRLLSVNHHSIQVEFPKSTYTTFTALKSWIGLYNVNDIENGLVKEAVALLPPGCLSTLVFRFPRLIGFREVGFKELKKFYPYSIPQQVDMFPF